MPLLSYEVPPSRVSIMCRPSTVGADSGQVPPLSKSRNKFCHSQLPKQSNDPIFGIPITFSNSQTLFGA